MSNRSKQPPAKQASWQEVQAKIAGTKPALAPEDQPTNSGSEDTRSYFESLSPEEYQREVKLMKEIMAEEIDLAMAEGLKAMGASFLPDNWRKALTNIPLERVRDMRQNWKLIVDQKAKIRAH